MAGQAIMLQGTIPERVQSNSAQRELEDYIIPMTQMRVHDDLSTVLPGTAATDDFGLIDGTYGTDTPTLETIDAKATTNTSYARFLWFVPPEYDSGQSIECRLRAGMKTTVSDGSATADVEVYKADRDAGAGADLVTTAATSINGVTINQFDDFSFVINGSSLVPGDLLDIRIAIAITDAATGTAVIGRISEVTMRIDIRMG